MARPRKKLTDKQIQEVETLDSDWSEIGPIVYGLAANDGVIVYVGATRNPKRRFAHYRINRNCHNKKLQEWLRRQSHAGLSFLKYWVHSNRRICARILNKGLLRALNIPKPALWVRK